MAIRTMLKLCYLKEKYSWPDEAVHEVADAFRELLPNETAVLIPNSFPAIVRRIAHLTGVRMFQYTICGHCCKIYRKTNCGTTCSYCGSHRTEHKIFHYFSIIDHIKRVYSVPHLAKEMRYYAQRLANPNGVI